MDVADITNNNNNVSIDKTAKEEIKTGAFPIKIVKTGLYYELIYQQYPWSDIQDEPSYSMDPHLENGDLMMLNEFPELGTNDLPEYDCHEDTVDITSDPNPSLMDQETSARSVKKKNPQLLKRVLRQRKQVNYQPIKKRVQTKKAIKGKTLFV